MDKKTKDFFITGAITWSVMLQSIPLVVAFSSVNAKKPTEVDKPQVASQLSGACTPEEASRKNGYVYGANCH